MTVRMQTGGAGLGDAEFVLDGTKVWAEVRGAEEARLWVSWASNEAKDCSLRVKMLDRDMTII